MRKFFSKLMSSLYVSLCNWIMRGRHTLRIQRLAKGRDSVCLRRTYTFAVILTILFAVATALIAPSIDMPDTVLREHQVSLHAAGAHATNNLLNTGIAVPNEAVNSGNASSISETLPSSNNGHIQSSVVLRC